MSQQPKTTSASLDTQSPSQEPRGDVVDRRIRALIDEYVRLSGAHISQVESGLLRLLVPSSEAVAYRGRQEHYLALDLDTLERNPKAELPVVGSALWENMLAAIRRRGQRLNAGSIPLTVTDHAEVPDVAVTGASVDLIERSREPRRIARVVAKVTIAAGTAVEEEIIQSDVIDLATGVALTNAIVDMFDVPSVDGPPPHAAGVASEHLIPALIQSLEEQLAPRVRELNEEAARDLKAELHRIDSYYEAVKRDVIAASGPGTAAVRTVEHEHEKRRSEEVKRHEVRVDVEPIQLLERSIMVERATWLLVTATGRTAKLNAQRYLTGDGRWGIVCECCQTEPSHIAVCKVGHAAGVECTTECSVCEEGFCVTHGHLGCAVDGAPVCEEHASECWSCERVHCAGHQGRCSDGAHTACTDCLVMCGICERTICRKHAVMAHEDAPRGARVLCGACVVYCEGAKSEPVGRDEAGECGTCDRYICERHQVRCVVDEKPHCSNHLRRSDRSGRFICEEHVATCDHEGRDTVFASDEVHGCIECGRASCDSHGAACHGDRRWHCREHMAILNDLPDALGCSQHRTTCHVDNRTFSVSGTQPCEVCTRPACRTHMKTCSWCGARVCTAEIHSDRCDTCSRLVTADDLPEDVISSIVALPEQGKVKQRLIARDGSRFVVQLDLGWMRRVVITLPHGATGSTRVIRHSLFGSRKLQR